MHYLDIVLGIILLVFFIWGIKRGFILSFMQVFGIILVFILIRQFGSLIRAGIHERIGISQTLATILGYILIFIIVMLLARFVSYLIKKMMELVLLGWVDKLLGGILGFIFGSFMIILLVLLFEVSSIGTYIGANRMNSKIYSSAHLLSYKLLLNVVYHMPGSQVEPLKNDNQLI